MRNRATLTLAIVLGLLSAPTLALAQDTPAAAFASVSDAYDPSTTATPFRDDGWTTTLTRETPRLAAPPREVRVPKPQPIARPAIWPNDPPKRPSTAAKGPHALTGIASYYWQGTKTASGEAFDKSAMTAAHPTLPFGTRVRVFCTNTGREVVVRINDRGPFKPGRIIDLSEGAAEVIGMRGRGLTTVQLQVIRH